MRKSRSENQKFPFSELTAVIKAATGADVIKVQIESLDE